MMSLSVGNFTIAFCLITVGFGGLEAIKSFPCKNKFISPSWFCDGGNDCHDGGSGSDESYGCDHYKCGSGEFTCDNSRCLPISIRCDLKDDCGDRSDELFCENEQFQCKDGPFINGNWFCDGEDDCSDRSDEGYGCNPNCGRGMFHCNSGSCYPISVRCDGKFDCGDESDEHYCDHVLGLTNCTLQEGKYLCKDETRCIPLKYACDGRYSCTDLSDEHENCFVPTDVCDSTCSHPCWRSLEGPMCFCSSTDGLGQAKCSKVEDCDLLDGNECEQKCVKYHGITQCSCNEGYNQSSNYNGSCFNTVPHENVLLYSDETSIVGHKLVTGEQFFILHKTNVTSISAANNYVYWSVSSNNVSKIFRKDRLFVETEELVFSSDTYSNSNTSLLITSIAIDWIANNTYFTSQTSLFVCKNVGNICVRLKYCVFGIESVGLLPRKGLMFWVENMKNKYHEARILKSSMDGSDERVIVSENLSFSNELAVDESSERIYWVDHERSVIESVKYNGKQRKVEIPEAHNVLSFAVFERTMYRTLKFNNGIFVGKNLNVWLRTNNRSIVKKIHIFNPLLQHTKISNPCASVPCAGLCLLRSVTTSPALSYTCSSSQHFNPETADRDVYPSDLPKNSNGHFETEWPMVVTKERHPILEPSTYENVEKIILRVIALTALLYVMFVFYSRLIKPRAEKGKVIVSQDMVYLE